MAIRYDKTKEFDAAQLKDLFLSVDWSSGQYPEKLQVAMRNSHGVCSAWDGERLVGLINCLSDGVMTAYFPYLLVNPDYQGQDIGKTLVGMMLQTYHEYARKSLISYDPQVGFYERCGFRVGKGTTPMSVTYLTT